MINLLPPEQKERLRDEERLRMVLIFGILFLSFLVCLSLVLFGIKTQLELSLETQRVSLEEKKSQFYEELEKQVQTFNQLLSQLNSFYQKEVDHIQILEKISNLLPSEIYLTNLDLKPIPEQNLIEVSLFGFSPNREALILLKKNLEEEKGFSEVSFPLENWLTPAEIQFRVNFKSKK